MFATGTIKWPGSMQVTVGDHRAISGSFQGDLTDEDPISKKDGEAECSIENHA